MSPQLFVIGRHPVWVVASAAGFCRRCCHRCRCPTSPSRASGPSAASDCHDAVVVAVVVAVAVVADVGADASGGAAEGAEDWHLLGDRDEVRRFAVVGGGGGGVAPL